jgi:hypothetical protein
MCVSEMQDSLVCCLQQVTATPVKATVSAPGTKVSATTIHQSFTMHQGQAAGGMLFCLPLLDARAQGCWLHSSCICKRLTACLALL